ncbi:hypothetical protein BDN70DRAFT_880289 [Pholiota conissans]|uniref:Uncharacterized protein n=1 Tax=Pholiota conissans TaxID=109636 RepID=A0A9P5YYV1_9AGAR|nr:hypothetical protein BDN70DRAFT_880289 [Pholiota conissans]
MSLLAISKDREIKDEIIQLANSLAVTQERLIQLAARVEDRELDVELKARYEKLQNAHKEAVNSAKWLRTQNIELEHRLEEHKPAVNNAVAARDIAFHKLKHARKVIRDLLAERPDMSSPQLTQQEIDEVLDESLSHSDSSSSDSDKTVRMGANMTSPSHSQVKRAKSSPVPSPHSLGVLSMSPVRNVVSPSGSTESINSPQSSRRISQPSMPSGSSSHALSQVQSPSSTRASPSSEPYQIHFKKPPGVSVLQEGPMTWQRLEAALKLDDNLVKALSNIALSPDVGMRLQIVKFERNIVAACLYDPILVDLPGPKSYILDWGHAEANRNLEKYIVNHKAIETDFHTFIFPTSENSWFYIGALQWSRVHLYDFWPELDEKNRKKILRKLCKRTNGEVGEEEMANLLDNKDLKQVCIELTAVGDSQISYAFATEVLGRQGSPYSPPRQERRAEGVKE